MSKDFFSSNKKTSIKALRWVTYIAHTLLFHSPTSLITSPKS